MRIVIGFFALSIWLTACGGKLETVEVKNDVGVLVERYSRNKENYAREGLYEKFSDEGVLLEKANYRNDTLHGERIIFFENGQKEYLETYVSGKFEGPYKAFYENGTLKLEGVYRDNQMQGSWKGYYDNGQLKEVVAFENNEENGPFAEYHANGKLKAEGNYLEGDHEHGELKLYDEEGSLFRKMLCDKGICRTTWLRDSTLTHTPSQ